MCVWSPSAVISCLPATQLLQSIHYKDRNFVAKEYIIHVLISLLHVLPFSVNLDFLEDFSC